MKVCGFSIPYNALPFGYPIEASPRSMLPLVDEFTLNIGEGDEETWNLVQSMREPKIRSFVPGGIPPSESGGGNYWLSKPIWRSNDATATGQFTFRPTKYCMIRTIR